MSSRRFRKRFLALSVGAHLSPLLGLVALDTLPEVPRKPPPPQPVAVSLLYVESKDAGREVELPERERAEESTARSEQGRDTRLRQFQRARARARASRNSEEVEHAGAGADADADADADAVREAVTEHVDARVGPRKRSLRERLRERIRGDDGAPQQDRERAMAENRRRIGEAIPLTLWDDEREREVIGTVRVRFILGRDGYVRDLRILDASETAAVNHAAHEVLHLAEPLLYVPGPIEMELEFRG